MRQDLVPNASRSCFILKIDPVVNLVLKPRNRDPTKQETVQKVEANEIHRLYFRDSLLKNIVYIIPTVVDAMLQDILKSGRKVTSEDRPLDFRENVIVARGEAMLEGIHKVRI